MVSLLGHAAYLLVVVSMTLLDSTQFLLFQKTYASFFVISHNTVDDVAECLARKLLAYVVPFHELKSCRYRYIYIYTSFLATCFMGKRVQFGVRPSKSDRFYASFRCVTVFFGGKSCLPGCLLRTCGICCLFVPTFPLQRRKISGLKLTALICLNFWIFATQHRCPETKSYL